MKISFILLFLLFCHQSYSDEYFPFFDGKHGAVVGENIGYLMMQKREVHIQERKSFGVMIRHQVLHKNAQKRGACTTQKVVKRF